MQFPERWEVMPLAERETVRPLMISRDRYLKQIVGRQGVVVLVGPRGSGKTALAYQAIAAEGFLGAYGVVQGWAVPSSVSSRHHWFSENSGCRALLVEDFSHALQADAIAFIAMARALAMRVILTSTTRLELPESTQIHLPDLTVAEARQLLLSQNQLAPQELRLSVDAVDSISALAPRLRTPRALISLAYRMVSDRSEKLDRALADLEGVLYESKIARDHADAGRIVVIQSIDSLLRDLRKQPESLFRLPSRRFEEIVAELLRDRGCAVHLTPSTRDGGFDMYASIKTPLGPMLCLVEAKRYAIDRPVGVEIVRQLYGTLCANDANSAMLVTTSRFSPDAREFQGKFRQVLALRDYFDLADWIATYGSGNGTEDQGAM